MHNDSVLKRRSSDKKKTTKPQSQELPQVIVCVDASSSSNQTIPHALAIARSTAAQVVLVHVIEPQKDTNTPFDPVEWGIRRRTAQLLVDDLATQFNPGKDNVHTQIMEGSLADRLFHKAKTSAHTIAVVCRRDDKQQSHIGEIARQILESGMGSVLMIPVSNIPDDSGLVSYTRIIVPLDGSARAENALPIAVRIALDQKAELVLTQATPASALMNTGTSDSQDIELQNQVKRRNEHRAQEYLEKVRRRLDDGSINARTVVLKGGDSRRLLLSLTDTAAKDLLVVTSHGSSGHADVPSGDVANYILAHSPVPTLMVRPAGRSDHLHIFSDVESKGIRRPEGSNP